MNPKRVVMSSLLLLLLFIITGCESKDTKESEYQMYYINKEETKIESVPYELKATSTEAMVDELIQKLNEDPDDVSLQMAKLDYVNMVSYYIEDGQVYITFDEGYYDMSKITEVLCRAAIVRTLTQVPDITYVSFYVGDNPLTDLDGNVVGIMTKDDFVENTGNEINSYTRAALTLYFTNETGDKLVATNVDVVYSSNISMEKLIIEQLIKGPSSDKVYPTIPPDTKLLSVSIKDGICYVNFDEEYLEQIYEVIESVPVYSVVNSLLELSNINKVQIAINGKTDITFREAIKFDIFFERKVDIIEGYSVAEDKEESVSE